ncbi:MAG: hypothetical protein U1E10_18130 [Bdellovibrionales bacterium]|nr:hypothetical protein [Bdellovibrionales bacterium]
MQVSRRRCFISVIAITFMASAAQASDLGGLKVFSAVDLVGDLGLENAPADSSRLKVRSFELATFGPVDPLFDATVNVAGHDEAGTIELELHEAYISSDVVLSKLLAGTRFKAGRYLLGIGRLNQFHSHEWPFTSAPKSHQQFFDEEAAIDTGLEVGHLFTPGSNDSDSIQSQGSWVYDIVLGVTNGWTYGHTHTGGRRPLAATHYLRPTLFRDLDDNAGIMIGLNYLGRTDADSVKTQLTGFDVTFKKREGKTLRRFLQSEWYHRIQTSSYLPLSEEVGGYVFYGQTVDEAGELSVGLRLDAFSNLSLRFLNGETKSNLDYAVVPNLSYRASEFSTFRITYGYAVDTRQGEDPRVEQKVELQLIALFGAHPAHDF